MIVKILLFIAVTIIVYYFGQPLDMIVFGRSCSSIYGIYAFLFTFILLLYFAYMKKGLLSFLIYLGIPLIGLLIITMTYAWLDIILAKHGAIILQSTISFYTFLFLGLTSIILSERRKK